MEQLVKSIRTFIGAKDYAVSRAFYKDLGFQEIIVSPKMSYFQLEQLGFYLQDAYVKDWIDNSMIFMEVVNLTLFYNALLLLDLPKKHKGVKLSSIRIQDWGSECYLHDPSGILWHFGSFNTVK